MSATAAQARRSLSVPKEPPFSGVRLAAHHSSRTSEFSGGHQLFLARHINRIALPMAIRDAPCFSASYHRTA